MKRKKPLTSKTPLKRLTRLRPRSKKREREMVERRAMVEHILSERPWCEAWLPLREKSREEPGDWHRTPDTYSWAAGHCQRRARDVHEPLLRSRGGSIVDEQNTMSVCRSCHDWCHRNPLMAHEVGMMRHSWEVMGE